MLFKRLISSKGIVKKLVISLFFSLIFFYLTVHVVFKSQFVELNVLGNKYCHMNISQNHGLHRTALVIVQKLLNFLPKNETIELIRDEHEVGVNSYKAVSRYQNLTLTHKIFVENETDLVEALQSATAGTEIIIKPGEYQFKGKRIGTTKFAGLPFEPIIIKAQQYGDVILNLNTREGLIISQPFWRIENLIFKGIKREHDNWIDHAVHIVGNAQYLEILNNSFINFNAHIKSNGADDAQKNRVFPNNVLIQHNNFYNEWKRNTLNPVVFIDVVGGSDWLIENNFIADFGKNGRRGYGISTGAYMKGGATNSTFKDNLVACEWRLHYTHVNDVRIGLSLGGGGTGKEFCMGDDPTCQYENKNGLIQRNTIVNCQNDVSVYLNKAQNSTVIDNILLNSLGIDVRFPESSVYIADNTIQGRIKARDGATIEKSNNRFY